MNLHDYLKNEFKKTKQINENTAELGDTDVFKGSDVMGPHHHKYVIWSVESGYGYTGDVILDNPDHKQLLGATDHIHLIMNWEVLPVGDGHSHILEKPEQIAPDTDIGSVPKEILVNGSPKTGNKI